jgi:hypothetical protein
VALEEKEERRLWGRVREKAGSVWERLEKLISAKRMEERVSEVVWDRRGYWNGGIARDGGRIVQAGGESEDVILKRTV